MHKKDLCSKFISLHQSPDCKNLDARLYVEVADGIVGKPLEKLWDGEATLKSLIFFFLILCLLLYSILEASILL